MNGKKKYYANSKYNKASMIVLIPDTVEFRIKNTGMEGHFTMRRVNNNLNLYVTSKRD